MNEWMLFHYYFWIVVSNICSNDLISSSILASIASICGHSDLVFFKGKYEWWLNYIVSLVLPIIFASTSFIFELIFHLYNFRSIYPLCIPQAPYNLRTPIGPSGFWIRLNLFFDYRNFPMRLIVRQLEGLLPLSLLKLISLPASCSFPAGCAWASDRNWSW